MQSSWTQSISALQWTHTYSCCLLTSQLLLNCLHCTTGHVLPVLLSAQLLLSRGNVVSALNAVDPNQLVKSYSYSKMLQTLKLENVWLLQTRLHMLTVRLLFCRGGRNMTMTSKTGQVKMGNFTTQKTWGNQLSQKRTQKTNSDI